MTHEFSPEISLADRTLGPGHRPYIIAEMSANHGGSLERALRIVEVAAAAGADALKLQAYTADHLTLDCALPDFVITGDNPWQGRRLHELYTEAATPFDWFPTLYARARDCGLTPFATPFDASVIPMLEALDNPIYKIASFEAVDYQLISACARTGKPLFVSTGMCSRQEVDSILETIWAAGGREVAILRCNSGYPARIEEADLLTLVDLAEIYRIPIGFSDHTPGVTTAIAAAALGASIIEKHVLDTTEPATPDSAFSALPGELEQIVQGCHAAFQARGRVRYGASPHEQGSLSFRRSLYAVADIAEGAVLEAASVRCIRPGFGLHPSHLPDVLGRRASRPIRRGEPLAWDMML